MPESNWKINGFDFGATMYHSVMGWVSTIARSANPSARKWCNIPALPEGGGACSEVRSSLGGTVALDMLGF
jgi:hypothetical protein